MVNCLTWLGSDRQLRTKTLAWSLLLLVMTVTDGAPRVRVADHTLVVLRSSGVGIRMTCEYIPLITGVLPTRTAHLRRQGAYAEMTL
jgi:hypothetical protein